MDPPTENVSGRCAMLRALLCRKDESYRPAVNCYIEYLRTEQQDDDSWFGRWGTNVTYC